MFYTKIEKYGNSLLYRGYDEHGNQIKDRIKYKPRIWLETDKPTKYHALDGTPVGEMRFPDMKQKAEFIKMYGPSNGKTIFGDIKDTVAYTYDAFPGTIQYHSKVIRVLNWDIETDTSDGYGNPETGDRAIISIAAKLMGDNISHVWGLKEFYSKDKNVVYHHCDSEGDLLREFVEYWEELNPDVITGWNIEFYDIPFLVNRLNRVFGDDSLIKRLSPWKIVRDQNVTNFGRQQKTFTFQGITVLDYMALFKKFTFDEPENFKLSTIAKMILKEDKIDYEAYGNLNTLYERNSDLFYEYNVKDITLIDALEDEVKLLEVVYMLAYMAGVQYEATLGTTAIWDAFIFRQLAQKRQVVPPMKRSIRQPFAGGYVADPIPGMHDWIMSFDLDSLYPNLIVQHNMSPETIVHHSKVQGITAEKVLSNPTLLKSPDPDLCMALNGAVFRRDKVGIIPEIITKLYAERKACKTAMLEKMRAAEATDDVVEKRNLLGQAAVLSTRQHCTKIFLNSLYGAMGNAYFRYFDIEVAEAVTLSGQFVIRTAAAAVNEVMNKACKTDDRNYIIAVDTDSNYIAMGDFVKQRNFPDPRASLDKFAKVVIEPQLKRAFDSYYKETNGLTPRMNMTREVIADRGFWTKKKRYVLNVLDSEGVIYAKPKLKIMGLEAIKSSTPQVCRDSMRGIFKIMIEQGESSAQAHIADARANFFSQPPEAIACPRGVSEVEKYKSNNPPYYNNGGKAVPIQSRASCLYNHYIKKLDIDNLYEPIHNGSKIKYIYLRVPNPIRENVIGFNDTLPPEMLLHEYIDYNLQFEKVYLKPIRDIFDILGWSTEPQSSLQSFFN
jgi:DNA polymerase elongation subunit (family B)